MRLLVLCDLFQSKRRAADYLSWEFLLHADERVYREWGSEITQVYDGYDVMMPRKESEYTEIRKRLVMIKAKKLQTRDT